MRWRNLFVQIEINEIFNQKPFRDSEYCGTESFPNIHCRLPISQYIQPFQDRKLLISIYNIPNEDGQGSQEGKEVKKETS